MPQHAISLKRALAQVAADSDYAVALRHGSMSAGIYVPRDKDDQEPHDQDEVYVVVDGTGFFVVEDERQPFGPGDLLFVEAGLRHRFENFTPNLAVWVVFYGPAGGEPETGEH